MRKTILLLVLGLIVTGCGSNKVNEVKTLNDFELACTDLSLTTTDNLLNYQTDSYIVGSKLCGMDEYHVEMIIYSDEDSAKKVQDQQIDAFMKVRNTMVTVDKDKGKNYYSFKMVTNGYYMVSTRIDNTLIFTQIPVDYKDDVDNILDKLGY